MREKIFNAIIASQENLIKNLEKSLELFNSTSDLDEESTIDLDDKSHQVNAQDRYNQTLKKLNMEKDDLVNIHAFANNDCSEIKEGAIVETEEDYFFFGYAFQPIAFNDKKILGVAPNAQAYQVNLNKKVGDKLELVNKELEIKKVF
ncbi:hypothetical protein KRX57_08595 [Weeksellaceae bacterium TAE3-ERU29]|nr:hypothetical protein [Weeksellaceae bacterium TAE3-ERU29]